MPESSLSPTLILGLIVLEMCVHAIALVWVIDHLCKLFRWLFPSKRKPLRFAYACGCAGSFVPLDPHEFEILCGHGPLRIGLVYDNRMVYDTRCEAHEILTSIPDEGANQPCPN